MFFVSVTAAAGLAMLAGATTALDSNIREAASMTAADGALNSVIADPARINACVEAESVIVEPFGSTVRCRPDQRHPRLISVRARSAAGGRELETLVRAPL